MRLLVSLDLPQPVTDYISAENGNDPDAMARCFADNAVVQDEGRTIEGLSAIKEWKAETKKKYQHTVQPLSFAQKGDKTIVTSQVAGNFPGSPVVLEFVFGLTADKIATLEIR
jgi:ketosteroid isomerase-like protein